MIPPVEERAVRPCYSFVGVETSTVCIYYDEYYECTVNLDRWKEFRDNFWEIDEGEYVLSTPCKYHITPDELKELIDSGVIP